MLKRPGKMFIAVAVFWLLLDFVTKQSVTLLMNLGDTIPVWEGVFHITYLRNSGAAFSMMQGQFWLFYLAMALLLVIIVWFWWSEKPRHWMPVVATAIVLAGAIGNTFDRVTDGAVIDMFDARIINFAVFNVADIGITVGCTIFIVWFLFFSGQMSRKGEQGAQQVEFAADPNGAAALTVEGESAISKADDVEKSPLDVAQPELELEFDQESAPVLKPEPEPEPGPEPEPKPEPKGPLKKRFKGTLEKLESDLDRDEF